MSRFSPICISDTDESDTDAKEEKNTVFFISDDEEETRNNPSQAKFNNSNELELNSSVKVKTEPEYTSDDSKASTTSLERPLTLNKKRIKWLSCQIKLARARESTTDAQREHISIIKNEQCKSDSDDADLSTSVFDLDQQNLSSLNIKSESAPVENEPALYSPTKNLIERESPIKKKEEMSSNVCKSKKTTWPVSSPCKNDSTATKRPRKSTPRKKTALERYINSPKKVGAFGSPEKSLAQTTLSKDSFSPKKLMTDSKVKLDDNSNHNPPLHACQRNIYGSLQCSKEVLSFTSSQLGYLESIEEEGHECTTRYIDSLLGLVTPYRKPPPDLCFRLLSETLLKSRNNFIAVKTFCALKRIQTLHPVVPEQMVRSITFGFLEEVVDRLEMCGCKCKTQQDNQTSIRLCLKASNALKTLTFLVDLMDTETKCKISPRRTIAFRLISLERNPGNISKVLTWINTCVKLCCNNTNAPDYHAILSLFQRLLQLCLSISEDPDRCAGNLAGELLNSYLQLPNLPCRTVFLQTLSSHLLRSKFLHLFAEVCCEKAEPRLHDSRLKGIQLIINDDFLCLPRKRDDVSNIEARMYSGFHRSSEECEEHAMVIAYSLQSYLFCHHKKLQSTPKKLAVDSDEEANKTQDRRHLSLLDTEEIVNMGDKVQVFAGRLLSLCPSLSERTSQLVELLSDMKVWDPW